MIRFHGVGGACHAATNETVSLTGADTDGWYRGTDPMIFGLDGAEEGAFEVLVLVRHRGPRRYRGPHEGG